MERAPGSTADAPSGEFVVLGLPQPAYIYDVRGHGLVGRTDRMRVAIGPGEAKLLALAPAPLPPVGLRATGRVHQGGTAVVRLSRVGGPLATDVFHVEITDPSGRLMRHYGANLIAVHGRAALRIPFARNDPAGMWTIRVTDVVGGTTQTLKLRVTRI